MHMWTPKCKTFHIKLLKTMTFDTKIGKNSSF